MRAREEIPNTAAELFEKSPGPERPAPEKSWLGIYQALPWHEAIHQGDYSF